MFLRSTGYASALALAVLICGCDDAVENPKVPVMTDGHHDDHDHGGGGHAHPETLGEALAELTELRDTVRDAFKNEDTEAAHGPLHDVGHLLDEVSEFADGAELSAEAKATITTNVETLLDAFGAVDKKMHSADEGSDYSEVSEKIDAALKAITEAAGPAGAHHDDHDGDHKEGDDDHADHKDGDADHKDADHKDGDHKDGDHKDGDHKDGDHKDAAPKEGEKKE